MLPEATVPATIEHQDRLGHWQHCHDMQGHTSVFRRPILAEMTGHFAVAAVLESAAHPFGLAVLPDNQAHDVALDAALHICHRHRHELTQFTSIEDSAISIQALEILAQWQEDTDLRVFPPDDTKDAATCAEISGDDSWVAEQGGFAGGRDAALGV